MKHTTHLPPRVAQALFDAGRPVYSLSTNDPLTGEQARAVAQACPGWVVYKTGAGHHRRLAGGRWQFRFRGKSRWHKYTDRGRPGDWSGDWYLTGYEPVDEPIEEPAPEPEQDDTPATLTDDELMHLAIDRGKVIAKRDGRIFCVLKSRRWPGLVWLRWQDGEWVEDAPHLSPEPWTLCEDPAPKPKPTPEPKDGQELLDWLHAHPGEVVAVEPDGQGFALAVVGDQLHQRRFARNAWEPSNLDADCPPSIDYYPSPKRPRGWAD